jgi:hydroxyquinol 1,2-dioxygenase
MTPTPGPPGADERLAADHAAAERVAAAEREQAVTDQVLASFAQAPPRLREVLSSLVRHLHEAAREVRLTEAEWFAAIDFLTRTGQTCDQRRQEFVLLSDVLGLSMLTVGINAEAQPAVTESTVFGPFFVADSPPVPLGGDLSGGAGGVPCWVTGTVRGVSGEPVPGARVEVWEADEDGLYDVQYPGARTANRGHLFTDADGTFRFWCVRPSAYPIPADGPVGDLLAATGRGPMRPAHIHFMITAVGHRRLITHVFAAGDPHLADDAVFGVKPSLVAPFTEHPGEHAAPPGAPRGGAWAEVRYDFVLAAERDESPERPPRSG